MTSLVDKVLAVAQSLDAAAIPYAFGGALALAYCTEDPRGTRDIDVNAFVPADQAAPVLAGLPAGVRIPARTAERIATDGQVRLWWDDTPVDLFLDYAPLHRQAARHVRAVPFAGTTIRILGPVELVLFKALFDRPKDWVDIAAVVDADAVDRRAVRRGLLALVGAEDPRLARWEALGA
ncbi:MAG: hypothetical protein LC789_11080 [Actinobacteria bacterium]|nr:hypothetical protein [Actinomycetota bacterium]MCA1722513.1 hypothetical protein [Actinomycetota bacterium]